MSIEKQKRLGELNAPRERLQVSIDDRHSEVCSVLSDVAWKPLDDFL